MTPEEIDLSAWHADGHTLTIGLGLFNGRDRNFGHMTVETTCPEGTICHQWAEAHETDHFCMVAQELTAMGPPDFIDGNFNTSALPDDWSCAAGDFPLEIEWRDMGEDGVEWRPKVTA